VDFPVPRRVTEASGSVVDIYLLFAVPDFNASVLLQDCCSCSNLDSSIKKSLAGRQASYIQNPLYPADYSQLQS
jgi:hypothetical protein